MIPQEHLSLIPRLAVFMEEYARCLDEAELERWPSFFAEECIYKVTSRENVEANYPFGVVYADSGRMLRDRVKSLRTVNVYEAQHYRHLIGMPRVLSTDGKGGVETRTSFLVLRIMRDGETTIFASGAYHDRLALAGDEIALRERIVVCDSSRIDTLLALPL